MPSFDWTDSKDTGWGLSSYQLWIDGKLWADGISESRYTLKAEQAISSGLHTWTVKAFDVAGNVAQADQTWSIRVDGDTPAPFALLAPDDNSWRADPFPVLTWQASSDAESGLEEYRLYMDDELLKDKISPDTTTLGFGDAAFADDFESGLSKWNLNGLWELTLSSKHSGDYALSSNPKGEDYNNAQSTSATFAQNVDLRTVEFATLKFWHCHDFKRYRDVWYGMVEIEYGMVEISKDGGRNWTQLASYVGSQENWKQVAIPLDEYTSANIQLRFRLNSGGYGESNNGWHIDDIEIVKGDALPEGSHTWYLVAVDKLGNETQSEQTWTFHIDYTPPEVPSNSDVDSLRSRTKNRRANKL